MALAARAMTTRVAGQAKATMVMAMVMAMTWVMAVAMRLVGDKVSKAKGGKSNGDSDEGGGQQRG